MTEKLYYSDAYLKTHRSMIRGINNTKEGDWLAFNETIFYPGGGGQLADRGKIGQSELIKVRVDEDDTFWHCIATGSGLREKDSVQMQIDWPWRYYNMQQHSAQHLISHILWEAGLKTVSVHLGDAHTLIEVEGEVPKEDLLEEMEDKVNALIREARTIKSFWVNREDIHKFPLRKPAGDWKELRIIGMEGLDYSACGGTHVQNTAEMGLIKYLGMEKIRGHARLKFVIGPRAYQYLKTMHLVCLELKTLLQTEVEELPAKVNSHLDELKQLKKENTSYRKGYIANKCQEIILSQEPEKSMVVLKTHEGTVEDWKEISRYLANEYQRISFIISGERFFLFVPENSNFDAAQFLSEYKEFLGLRGGGSSGFVEGRISKSDIGLIRDCLKKSLKTEK